MYVMAVWPGVIIRLFDLFKTPTIISMWKDRSNKVVCGKQTYLLVFMRSS
jgi:hypothetical protein